MNKRVKEGTTSTEAGARAEFRLNQARKQAQQSLNEAGGATQRLTGQQRQAAEAASLLAARLGIQMPRSVNAFIGSSRLIGPALQAAFSAGIVLAMGAAILALIPKVTALVNEVLGVGGAWQKVIDLQRQANDEARTASTNLRGVLGAQLTDTRQLITAKEKEIEQLINEIEVRKSLGAAAATGVFNTIRALGANRRLAQAFERLEQLRKDEAGLLASRSKLLVTDTGKTGENTAAIKAQAAALREVIGVEATRRPTLFRSKEERELFTGPVPVRDFQPILDLAPEVVAAEKAIGDQAVATSEVHDQAFQKMASDIDQFFQRAAFGARSWKDLMKQIYTQLLSSFLSMLARMLAAWIATKRGMAVGSVFGGGGGGGFFDVIGSALGLGGGGGFATAGAASGGGSVQLDAQGNVISAGSSISGRVIDRSLPAAGGGGGSATNLSGLAALGINPGLLFGAGLGAAGVGLLSSGIGSGSPLRGAIGGGLAGLGLGVGIGSLLGAPLAIGLAAGVVPGLILAGIGALLGALARGKKKKQASRIAEAGFDQMREVVDQFRRFETDFESALSTIDAVWVQMQDAWRQLGGSILRRSVRGEQPEFNQIRGEILEIQKMREARGGLLRALPIPEFAAGGFTNDVFRAINRRDGAMLAVLHRDEAVLNSRATAMLGRSFIEQANRAPSFQTGGFTSALPQGGTPGRTVNLTVHVHPSAGMNEEALANFTIRKLKRELRDRGVGL